jgi:hypothetical protein
MLCSTFSVFFTFMLPLIAFSDSKKYFRDMIFLFLLSIVHADSFFSNVSEEINIEIGGTWAIPIHDGYQWWLGMGQASDLWIAPMFEGSWFIDMAQTKNLSNVGTLRDHSFRKCSDGSFLHLSGGDTGSPNQIFRYDSAFDLISQQGYPQADPPHATNDVPAICGDSFDGFGIAEGQGREDFFVEVDDNSTPSSPILLPDSPRMTGAGLTEVNEQLIVAGMDPGPDISISVYDTNFDIVERALIAPISEEILHYWPSRIEKIGEYYLIATMGRDPLSGFGVDNGDLYFVVVNQAFETQEWLQLSFNDPESGGGGMRPWFEYYEDQLVIGYDKSNSLYLYTLNLNLDKFQNLDSSEPSSEPSTEPSVEPDAPAKDGCGANQALLLPFLWGVFSYRRKKN